MRKVPALRIATDTGIVANAESLARFYRRERPVF
jgi:hypothetical protein